MQQDDRTERRERADQPRADRRRPEERIASGAPDGGGASRDRLMSRTRPSPTPLTYLPVGERPLRRVPQLFVGLALYGFSLSVLVRASLGVNPWSVLYEGLELHTSLSFGMISAVLGVLVLLLWIPLKQRPTFGTVANVVVLAYSSDLGLWLLPQHLGSPPGSVCSSVVSSSMGCPSPFTSARGSVPGRGTG